MQRNSTASLFLTLLVCSLMTQLGCVTSYEPDTNSGIEIKIDKALADAERKAVQKQLMDLLDSNIPMASSMSFNGKTSVYVGPVEDVQKYADNIEFAKVTKVENRVIWIEMKE